ncbi:MAG: HAD hydrolase family protein [Candidatus Lambdaproteobacteria bacterium]|nr:HAD hydrolase family protein [Candidatus Lambdaproteobacteria bacterium]
MARDLPYRYLLMDLDGTLLDSRGRISGRNRRALALASSRGLTLVLASGRTYPSLYRVGRELGLPFHLIANGGAVGLGPGLASVLHTSPLPADLWPEVVAALEREALPAVVFSHRHPEPPLFYAGAANGHSHFEAYLGRHREHARVLPALAGAEIPCVVEVAALGAGAHFEAASRRVMARFAGRARTHSMVLFLSAQYGRITEFFAAGTSKWHAFLAMFPDAARHPETVIALGDEANDHEMIATAGLGIAMGNATPELKAVARRVSADHDHDGVAEALEPLLLA